MIEGTVKLNGYWYNLASKVVAAYHSRMPGKVNTGPDDFSKEQFLSSWIISDQRGGIGIDEMDESIHADRCWWTNCIIDYDGHTTLPRLATSIALPSDVTIVNADMELDANWTTEAGTASRQAAAARSGTYGWQLDSPDDVSAGLVYQDLSCTIAKLQGATISITGYAARGSGTGAVYIGINDGVGTTWSTAVSGAYAVRTVTRKLDAAATRLRIYLRSLPSAGVVTRGYFDDFTATAIDVGTISKSVNFNGNLYVAAGSVLLKLNSARDGFNYMFNAPATIADLLIGPNGSLLVYLGDTENYWYMTTAEAFTQTNVNDATLGVLWDSKAWKLDADGNWWYSTDGDSSATPTWTGQTAIADNVSQIERLEVGRNGDGDPVIYCSTNTWLKTFDFTNNKWINTEVQLYGNQHHGKGFVYWNAAHYLSYGLGVKQYSVGSNGTLSDVGLNRDGGLPSEYNGIIVKLTSGGDQLFALVDASLTSGNSQSGLYAFTGRSWRCWWAQTSTLIDDCEDAWNESVDADVTASLDTTDFQVGAGSAKFVCAAGLAAGDIIATEAVSSKDLSGHNYVSFRIKSTVALDAGDLQLLLDNTANCASPLETLDIPAVAANTWTKVDIALSAASSDTAIISVGLKMVVDKGAFTVNIDHIEGYSYNGAMHDVIVSPAASAYAVYWDCGGKFYYADMPPGLSNPKYLEGTQTYEASGIHLSPWFDAGNQAFQKLAKAIVSYAKKITTTETVAIKYRTNKTYTDRDTGWTTIETLNTTGENGENIEQIASGAGTNFNSFQFRLDLARGSTNTLSPDMLALVLGYRLVTQGNWSWTMTLSIDHSHNTTPKEKWDNLKSAIESRTDIPFIFRFEPDDTHYVQFLSPREITAAGKEYEGEITVQVLEPWLP